MKKEIGSIFPLYPESFEQEGTFFNPKDRILYSLCREAFTEIAKGLCETNRTVLIPAYTCQTVITPFEEAGWACIFFNVFKSLRIDVNHLNNLVERHHPSLLVVHPYFGMDLDENETKALLSIKNFGVKVVVDLTQCIFSNQKLPFADYIVGSYRKWFAIPDGGFMITQNNCNINQPIEENEPFVERQTDAMYLRGQYFRNEDQRTKQISIRLSKSADHVAEKNISPHRMSVLSCQLLEKEDKLNNQQRRINNFNYLHDSIKKNNKYAFVCTNIDQITTAPLYFTIYVENRRDLQLQLAKESIYAPVIWPVEDEKVLISENVRYIYDHLLAIPIDQRYDERDMERVVDVINNF